MDDKLQKTWEALSTKYEMPDFDTFKSDILSNPDKRAKAYEGLQGMFEMPSYEKFEADILGNVPSNGKYDVIPLGRFGSLPINETISGIFELIKGGESGVVNAPDYVNAQIGEMEKATLTMPGYLVPQSPMPFFVPDPEPRQLSPEETETRKKEVDKVLHKAYTNMANTRKSMDERYMKIGVLPLEDGFVKEQLFSLGMNLPYLAVGGGAGKLGLTAVSNVAKTLAFPLFTQMEASFFAGEVYGDTAKKDAKGYIIEGTGDLSNMPTVMLMGTIAGTLEFVGVSQAVNLLGKLGRNELKGLGYKTFAKELGLVSLAEGGEEVSQDAIEQLTKMGLNLQDSFSFKQSLDSFIAGGVGGILLGGVSVGANVNQLGELKKFAETVPTRVDKMVKDGRISKEKGETYKKAAEVLLGSPQETLGESFKMFQESQKVFEGEVEASTKKFNKELISKVYTNPEFIGLMEEVAKKQGKSLFDYEVELEAYDKFVKQHNERIENLDKQAIEETVNAIKDKENYKDGLSEILTKPGIKAVEKIVVKSKEFEELVYDPSLSQEDKLNELYKTKPELFAKAISEHFNKQISKKKNKVSDEHLVNIAEGIDKVNKEVTNDITQTILGIGKGLDVYDKITNSDIEDPYGRYEYAITDEKTREQLIKRLESTEEFQNLQKETAASMPNAKPEDVLKVTHNRIHKEGILNEEKTQVLTEGEQIVSPLIQAKERMKTLSIRAGEALNLINSVFEIGSDMMNQGDDVFMEKSIPADLPKGFKSYTGYKGPNAPWGPYQSKSKFRDKIEKFNAISNRKLRAEFVMRGEGGIVNAIIVDDEVRPGEQQNIHFEKDTGPGEQPILYNKEVLKFDEAVGRSERAQEILSIVSKNDKIALVGSLALSLKGKIFRKAGRPVHDLDLRTSMNADEVAAYMAENFPTAKKFKDFSPLRGGRVIQYVVFPENLKEERDENGRLIGIKKEEMGRVIAMDFFLEQDISKTFKHEFKIGDITNTINVLEPDLIFQAKMDIGRQKDVEDLLNYILYSRATGEISQSAENVQGINISSYEAGLGGLLSNFAKTPIEFRGKKYPSSEAAYQANKTSTDDASVLALMIEVLTAKLKQYPRLVSEITKRGGSKFLRESTHNLVKQGKTIKSDRWTGKDGLFMQALRAVYPQFVDETAIEATLSSKVSGVDESGRFPNKMPLKRFVEELGKRKKIPGDIDVFANWLFENADPNIEVSFENPDYVIGKDKSGLDIKLNNDFGAWTRDIQTRKPSVVINRSRIQGDLDRLWKTATHEITHDYLYDALDPKSKKFNLSFYNAVSALMKEMKFRMDTDHNLFYRENANDLKRPFENIQEFAAYMLAKNSILADWAANTQVSNKTKQTYLGKFIDTIKKFFAKVGLKSPTFMDAMETAMNQFFGSPAQIDFWNEVFEDTSDVYDTMKEAYDQFEKIQDPDSSLDNPKLIRAIGKILADNIGEKPSDYIAYVKSLTFTQFRGRVLSLPEWNKSVELYYDTQAFKFSVPELKEKLITQLYEYAVSLELHPTTRLVTRYDPENDALTSTIEELGDYYRDKENSIKSGWRNKINLSQRLDQLAALTGIQFELVYLDDTKHIVGDKTTWRHINAIDFGTKARNDKYSRLLARHNILFPGTWSDKGTVVALRPLTGKTVQDVYSALNEIQSIYNAKIAELKAAGVPFNDIESTDPAILGNMTMRLLIEDLRMGGQIGQDGKLQTSLFNPENPDSYDLIKILKRPTEVAPQVATVQTKDRVANALKSNPIGIVEGPDGLENRSMVFNAKPEKGEWLASVIIKGREVKFDMADVLVNLLGTETTDGNVYFLDEGFGKTYRYLHGVINPGGMKVWVGNSVSGNFSTPLFVKGFWQKVSTKDLFGLWMKQNNVTVAISSTAMKVNGGYQISNLSDPKQTQIFNIPFNNIYRDKEKGIVKKSVKGLIQSLTANLDTKDNEFYDGDYSEYYDQLRNNLVEEFVDTISDMTPETILEELKEVAMNATSQYEQGLARIILDIAYSQADEKFREANAIFFVDSKEYSTKRRITNTRLAKDLGGLFHEPFFAEIIKSKISKAIHKVINHRGSATWMMLRPDVGYAEPSHIEALFDTLAVKEQRKRSDKLTQLYDERDILVGGGNNELVALVDADIKRIKESLEYQTVELQEKIWEQMNEYIDPVSGRLLEGNAYVSEDAMEIHNVENLDYTVITMVPSDGMTAQQAVRAIPISLDYVDPGTISANSEQTQTVGGKDFDGDSTHFNSYDPKYGTRKAWDKYIKTIQDTTKKHKQLTLKYYRNVLNDKTLQEADIYDKKVQLKFMQILSDLDQSSDKKYWNPRGMFKLLDLFQKDVAGVVSARKYMTVKSQLGFSSQIVYNKRTRHYRTNHKRIPLYYLVAMRLTHDAVDKPSNENGLHYEFDDLRMAELMYGENYGYKIDNVTVYDDKDRPGLFAVQAADKFLFGYGLQFTTGRNLQDRDMDRGLAEDLNYISTQQNILKMLESGTTGKNALARSFRDWYIPRHTNQTPEQANHIIGLAQQYIQNANMSKPNGSPVMEAVKGIPLYRIPNIGTSRNVYLAWQYRISREMNKGREELIARVSDQWSSAINEFRSRMNQQYVTNFLLTSENSRLHLVKSILIDFILPVDQRLFKEGAHEGKYHTDIFNKANEVVYPRLIRLLLEGKTFIFNKANEATLTTDKSSVTFSRTPYSGMKVSYKNAEGETIQWKSGYDLLHEQSAAAAKVRNLLFHSKGLFSTYANRYNFSQFISFGRNIPMQGRIDFATEFLNTVLPKFSEVEKNLFWDSLLGYPDVNDEAGVSKAKLEEEPGMIKTPMNLVSFGKNEHPDQKTLLQIAEIVDDASGREFLKRYARLATTEYPGIGLDQSITINREIEDGDMSESSPILFTQDYRDDVNDETKSHLDKFKSIFDIIRKSKTSTNNYGVYPRLFSGRIGRLTKLDVSQSVATHTTRTETTVNDEMIALKKAEQLMSSIKVFDNHLRVSYNRIESAIQELRGVTGLTKSEIISKINLLSENFLGVEFSFNNETGRMSYIASNGETYSDKNLDAMLTAYEIPRQDFGYYKAALELRKIYDYWNIRLVQGTINYLTYLRDNLPEGFINAPIINASINKWTRLLAQFQGMSGRYFPRMFPEETYNGFVEEWALWNVVAEMYPEAERAERYRDLRGSDQLSEEVQRRVNQQRMYLTVDKHDDYVYPWQRGRVVPDWLAAGRYITDTMNMHSRHMLQFQNAIVNDITRAEWLLYEHNASMREQTKEIITQMRGWFANLTTDRYLKSEKVKTEELKQGDQIAFYYMQGSREKYIRGEVLRTTDGSLIMSLDAEQAERYIREQIARYSRTHDDIVTNPLIDPNRDATGRQMRVIEDLRSQGYNIPEEDYTILGANDAIITGLNQLLADRENWGRFDLDRVYVKQYNGIGGVGVNRKVERQLQRGKVDEFWKGFQLFTADVFLGTPGSAVRNFMEAKYRIVQTFGWLRYFNVPGAYYKLLDALPVDLQQKFPYASRIPRRTNEIYSGIRQRSKKFVQNFVSQAEKGDTADFYNVLYPVITGQKAISELVGEEKMELVGAFAAKYIMENGLAGKADIGNAFVKEVGTQPGKELWDRIKSLPLEPFLRAEGRVRREAAFLYAYKAIFYDGLTNPKEINAVIEKGVGFANSLYDMMYRKVGEGSPSGKVAFQFSQFNTFQKASYKNQLRQAIELGQLKEPNTLENILFNMKAFLTTQQVIQNPDGTTTTHKIGDSVDPYIPGQMTKFLWQDSIGMVFEMAFPGMRVGNPVNRLRIFVAAMIMNMIITGELPDDWDISDWLFTLLGFRLGLGLLFPAQMLWNLIVGRDKIASMPKMTTFAWDLIADQFTEHGKVDKSEEYYTLGKWSKFWLSFDATPHTRKYYTDEQNRLTGTAVKKIWRPFVETQSIGGFNIPLPSPDLIPVINFARYKRR